MYGIAVGAMAIPAPTAQTKPKVRKATFAAEGIFASAIKVAAIAETPKTVAIPGPVFKKSTVAFAAFCKAGTVWE